MDWHISHIVIIPTMSQFMFCAETLALHGNMIVYCSLNNINNFKCFQIAFAWGFPAIISGFLVAFDSNVMSGEKHNPSFQYGNAQAAISVFMLVMCFIGKKFYMSNI